MLYFTSYKSAQVVYCYNIKIIFQLAKSKVSYQIVLKKQGLAMPAVTCGPGAGVGWGGVSGDILA